MIIAYNPDYTLNWLDRGVDEFTGDVSSTTDIWCLCVIFNPISQDLSKAETTKIVRSEWTIPVSDELGQ